MPPTIPACSCRSPAPWRCPGASIVDAQIFTTMDGMALDALGFQDASSRLAVDRPDTLGRIRDNIEKALRGEIWLEKALAGRRSLPKRAPTCSRSSRAC